MTPGSHVCQPQLCCRHRHVGACGECPPPKPDFKAWASAVDEAASLMSDETGRSIKDFSLWELMVWLVRKNTEQEWYPSHNGQRLLLVGPADTPGAECPACNLHMTLQEAFTHSR